jgi:hypothetical protein
MTDTAKMIRCVFGTIGVLLLLVGIASLVVLIKIGGKSDGPGAIVFYIGVMLGGGGGLLVLFSLCKMK